MFVDLDDIGNVFADDEVISRAVRMVAPRKVRWTSAIIQAARLAENAGVLRATRGRRKICLGSWLE